jgi:hypothetical protein
MVRGEIVMQDGKVVGPGGHGEYLRRAAAPKEEAIHA